MRCVVLWIALGLGGLPALGSEFVPPSRCLPGARDYGFLGWAEGRPPGCHGIHDGGALDGRRGILCVRTGFYGLALDARSPRILGPERIEGETASVVDQSVHGGDFWQTDYDPVTRTWSRTYPTRLDAEDEPRRGVRFRFR